MIMVIIILRIFRLFPAMPGKPWVSGYRGKDINILKASDACVSNR